VEAAERYFHYTFADGHMKGSFTPKNLCRIRAVVYRDYVVSDEKKEELASLKQSRDYYGQELENDEIKGILVKEYDEMLRSAEAELNELQTLTCGPTVQRAVRGFEGMAGYEVYSPADDLSDAFPFNFGVILRKCSDESLHFYCMANESCRLKPRLLPLDGTMPLPPVRVHTSHRVLPKPDRRRKGKGKGKSNKRGQPLALAVGNGLVPWEHRLTQRSSFSSLSSWGFIIPPKPQGSPKPLPFGNLSRMATSAGSALTRTPGTAVIETFSPTAKAHDDAHRHAAIISEHVREMHWNQLLQTNYFALA
jgi:hypothetical protein